MTIADLFSILVEPSIWLLWAFYNPLDLRTDPLQEEGDDVTPIRLIALGQRLGPFLLISFIFLYFNLIKVVLIGFILLNAAYFFQAVQSLCIGNGL